ncbi:MAG: hypothetical protein Q7T76_09045 [Ferruginibacter sp.]|nr:hypothetical protein [Ferruginibacter sp.]
MRLFKDYEPEKFTKHFPIITIFLLITATSNLYFFYSYFNILIFEYISVSEIILSSFSVLLLYFVIVLTSFVCLILLLSDLEKNYKDNTLSKNWFLNRLVWIFVSVVIVAAAFAEWHLSNLIKSSGLLGILDFLSQFILLTFYSFLIAFAIFQSAYDDYHKNNTPYSLSTIIATSMIFPLLLTMTFGNNKMFTRIQKFPNEYMTEFYFNDNSKIFTNDSIYYLGKTNSHYFFWNKSSKSSTIISASEIKKVVIHQSAVKVKPRVKAVIKSHKKDTLKNINISMDTTPKKNLN